MLADCHANLGAAFLLHPQNLCHCYISGAKPPGTPIIDYSRLIDHMVSKSRLQNYGRDHDR